jgi:hypothetical protein
MSGRLGCTPSCSPGAVDLDCAELKVDPRTTNSSAQGAVAVSGLGRGGRESQPYGTAMTGSLMHGFAPTVPATQACSFRARREIEPRGRSGRT